MDAVSNSTGRAVRSGPNDWLLGFLSALVAVVALILLVPSGAAGHAGEVHTDEPAPAVNAPGPGNSGSAAEGKGPTSNEPVKSAKRQAGDGTVTRTASESPPPPEVPDSDPTLHFLALGAVALVGTGLIFLRRRSALG